jgi:hypothetical protein
MRFAVGMAVVVLVGCGAVGCAGAGSTGTTADGASAGTRPVTVRVTADRVEAARRDGDAVLYWLGARFLRERVTEVNRGVDGVGIAYGSPQCDGDDGCTFTATIRTSHRRELPQDVPIGGADPRCWRKLGRATVYACPGGLDATVWSGGVQIGLVGAPEADMVEAIRPLSAAAKRVGLPAAERFSCAQIRAAVKVDPPLRLVLPAALQPSGGC